MPYKDREKQREAVRLWHEANREKVRKRARKRYAENLEAARERDRERARTWRAEKKRRRERSVSEQGYELE
jgi:hypothetical protein